MKVFPFLLLFLATLVSSSILPGFIHKDENDTENASVLHEDFPSTTTSSSRSISALDAEGFFDEEPDTHTEIDPAKVKVTNPIEIYKMCKAKKDCPGAWLYSNGRCVHPEIEEMRRRGGFRDHPLFERARRLFY